MQRIIVIRRDNIGDLICTTPLIHALRRHFPHARIDVLVNSYNRAVLARNPDIDEVHYYTKQKHREGDESPLSIALRRAALYARLRRMRYDCAIVAGSRFMPRGLKLARILRPEHIVGITEPGHKGVRRIDMGVPYGNPGPLHEVEGVFRLAEPLGIRQGPGPLRLFADALLAERLRVQAEIPEGVPLVGIHIGARKASNRWPVESFVALVRALHRRDPHRSFALFWSPGDEDNPRHPGDDRKLAHMTRALRGLPIYPVPSRRLEELIAGMSLCRCFVLSDGGALHIAAALGKPVVSLFGRSDAARWRPWGVPYRVLQRPSQQACDIAPEEVAAVFWELLEETEVPRGREAGFPGASQGARSSSRRP